MRLVTQFSPITVPRDWNLKALVVLFSITTPVMVVCQNNETRVGDLYTSWPACRGYHSGPQLVLVVGSSGWLNRPVVTDIPHFGLI